MEKKQFDQNIEEVLLDAYRKKRSKEDIIRLAQERFGLSVLESKRIADAVEEQVEGELSDGEQEDKARYETRVFEFCPSQYFWKNLIFKLVFLVFLTLGLFRVERLFTRNLQTIIAVTMLVIIGLLVLFIHQFCRRSTSKVRIEPGKLNYSYYTLRYMNGEELERAPVAEIWGFCMNHYLDQIREVKELGPYIVVKGKIHLQVTDSRYAFRHDRVMRVKELKSVAIPKYFGDNRELFECLQLYVTPGMEKGESK